MFNEYNKEIKMLIEIIDITDKEIDETVNRSCEQSLPVMYLENNGQKNHKWEIANFQPWLESSLDD